MILSSVAMAAVGSCWPVGPSLSDRVDSATVVAMVHTEMAMVGVLGAIRLCVKKGASMGNTLGNQDTTREEPSREPTAIPLVAASVDMQVQWLSQTMGGLTNDEHALAYGVLYACDASRGLDTNCESGTTKLAALLVRFRWHNCAWCHAGLAEHRLDFEADGLQVRCQRGDQARPVDVWLQGPLRVPVWRWVVAVTLWVGIPLVSLGLLAWVMPTVAALVHHRRSWVVAASVWIASFIVTIVLTAILPDALLTGFFLLAQWAAAVVYGGLQVKQWLVVLPPPKRQRPSRTLTPPESLTFTPPVSR